MRKQKRKRLKRTFFIFCEWETEKCYFDAFREIKRSNTNVKIESFKSWQIWTTKKKVSNYIDKIYEKISYNFEFSKKQLQNTNSKIYLLLDTDAYKKMK